jgi:3-oxoadipate enol-lactonase
MYWAFDRIGDPGVSSMSIPIASLTTPDGRFSYQAAGSRHHTPLVFLHGIGGNAPAWRDQLGFFGDRYHAIAWDMPGYGGSAPLAAATIATLAAELTRFLIAVEARRPVLVGHSIGGMIVQQFLADHPGIAGGAVLAQTSPAFGKPDGDWQKAFIAARLDPLDRGATMRDLAAGMVGDLVGDDPDPRGLEAARASMAAVPDATYRAMVHALVGFDQRAALKRIDVPTLVLSGSRDTNAPAPMMAKMASYIPGARYVEIAGAGHLVNLEQPGAFNAALDDFLATSSFGRPAS